MIVLELEFILEKAGIISTIQSMRFAISILNLSPHKLKQSKMKGLILIVKDISKTIENIEGHVKI
jgi:hypothetical protein|tara:strand:+ start:760 stop:954 length:195 start_codon:yes stop_codon:yes gene_type:complete